MSVFYCVFVGLRTKHGDGRDSPLSRTSRIVRYTGTAGNVIIVTLTSIAISVIDYFIQ